MTAPAEQLPPTPNIRREATDRDIAGLRIYYKLAGDDGERWIDWPTSRGITVGEGIAVKRKTPSDVSISRMRAVVDAIGANHVGLGDLTPVEDDPEALQALIWLVRNVRQREALQIVDLDTLNVLSVRCDFIDSDGIALDFPDEVDPADHQAVADLAAAIGPFVPRMDQQRVYRNAAALIAAHRALPDPDAEPEEEDPGEGSAGSAPSEPAASE